MKIITCKNKKSFIVDDDVYEWAQIYTWRIVNSYVARSKRYGSSSKKAPTEIFYLHREIFGLIKGDKRYMDHLDGDKLNNQRSNLRICTNSENSCNRGKQLNNKSGYKGVCWNKEKNKWTAEIKVKGKRTKLGYFKTKEEAAISYNTAAIALHGEFAKLNVIK